LLPDNPWLRASGINPAEGVIVTLKQKTRHVSLLLILALASGACSSGPSVTKIQDAPDTVNAPFQKILVISLFQSFDTRRYLEQEIVKALSSRGVDAVAMTSLKGTDTPVNRESVLEQVKITNADAVLLSQLISLETSGEVKNMRPQATYNFRPTYYYNVFSVELTEYREPQNVEFSHSLALETDLYSAADQERVWAIATDRQFKEDREHARDYSKFVDEANAIVNRLSRDKLIAR
jgi:hypothetical protein